MSTTVRIEFNAAEALATRGLGTSDRVQQIFTSECARFMDEYVPMQTGILKNTRSIELDRIVFNQPYARFHYFGKLMLASNGSTWARSGERKVLTDKDMAYHGSPTRGPFWDKRMWADNKDTILSTAAKAAGGRYE